MMHQLTVKDIEYVAHRLAKETLSFNEPIPEFYTRFPHRLESCLAVPFMSFGGKHLYEGLLGKASILFYLMIKNHPFQNGNKRIAMTTLFVFLLMNKKWIKVNTDELYKFTIWVAESPAKTKDGTVKAIEEFLGAHLIDVQA